MNNEPPIVYVITDGAYSDYHIVAVVNTRERANELEKSGFGGVEEYYVDAPIKGQPFIEVEMDYYGQVFNTICVESHSPMGAGYWRDYPPRNDNGKDKRLVWSVQTDDTVRAIKVVNEKRTQILAMDLWGDPRGLDVVS